MNVALVPREEIPTLWAVIGPLLAPAIKQTNGRQTAWGVLAALQKGEKQVWIAFDEQTVCAAVTTSIGVYEGSPWLHIGLCGGHGLTQWFNVGFRLIEEFARAHGCRGILITGRKGWQRLLGVAPSAFQFERLLAT